MIGFRRDPCRAYRTELAVIATGREAVDAEAHEHLARCSRCRDEAQGLALASVALGRLTEDVERAARRDAAGASGMTIAAHASPDPSWLAVRRRATAARGPLFRWRGHLAGLIVGAGLATAIIAPLPAGQADAPLYDSGTVRTFTGSRDIADQKAEDTWLWANQHARKESSKFDIVMGPYDPSVFGEGPFQPVPRPSDMVGLRAR